MKFTYRTSLITASLIAITFWLIFLPGFYSSDSIGVLGMVKSGELNSAHTAPYAIFVKIMTFSGSVPGLVTLVNSLVLVFATTAFIWEMEYQPKIKFLASLIISSTPLIWAMGITLWHDIPFTAGLLMFLVSIARKRIGRSWVVYALFAGVLLSFRPNWIPLMLALGAITIIFKSHRSRNTLIPSLTTITVASVSFFGASFLIKEPAVQVHYAQEWIRNDLSCFAAKDSNRFTRELTPFIGSVDEWKSAQACTFLNDAKLDKKTLFESYEQTIPAWIKLLQIDPLFILRTHLERNNYLVPIPFYGVPVPPFLHTNIEVESPDLKWANPQLAEQIRLIARSWNLLRGIFAFAGLWVFISLFIALRRKSNFEIFSVIASISLLLTLFVFAPIPDGRYALPALVIGQCISLLYLLRNLEILVKTVRLRLQSDEESKSREK